MPWRDWQFWVVTLAAAGGLWLVVLAVRPRRRKGRKVSLTIDGERPADDPPAARS